MQYWIFYQAGVGGDGFANLLEHANNIHPADGNLEWRIHYYDNQFGNLVRPIRFYQAKWAEEPLPFRYNTPNVNTVINPVYVDIVNTQQNTVITAHHSYFNLINQFKYKDIVTQDQVKIHLYSDNADRVYKHLKIKRGYDGDLESFSQSLLSRNNQEFKRTEYSIHINIEQAWRDWDYMQECMTKLGIDLPRNVYDHYLSFIDI